MFGVELALTLPSLCEMAKKRLESHPFFVDRRKLAVKRGATCHLLFSPSQHQDLKLLYVSVIGVWSRTGRAKKMETSF